MPDAAGKPHDKVLIVAMRTADFPEGGADAAAEALCTDCHESVWWSPATVEMVRSQGLPVHVRCNRCANRLGIGGPPEPPTEAQRLEIAAATGLYGDALDRTIQDIRHRLYGGPGVGP